MPSMLAKLYPSLRLDEVCRVCCGKYNPEQPRCKACKMTPADYKKKGLEREIEEYAYLKRTWAKVRQYAQITTGIAKLDWAIELLCGKPHNFNWRNYKKIPAVVTDKGIVLRLANEI